MQTQQVRGVATVTYFDSESNMQVIRYHSTAVVMFDNEKIILNTGGWSTMTTKTRMNQASNQYNLGYQVYQKGYKWFVKYGDQLAEFKGDKMLIDRGTGMQEATIQELTNRLEAAL